jgi:hypothetical protein
MRRTFARASTQSGWRTTPRTSPRCSRPTSTRVGWIETNYLGDPDRTLAEIKAALLALSVHGKADATVPRTRVIAAYRLFIQQRRSMAGFVAQELADWEYWDATADYVEVLKSNAVKDPAAHFLIVSYLQRSPRSAAKDALRKLADSEK